MSSVTQLSAHQWHGMSLGRVHWMLDNWAAFERLRLPLNGYPSRASGMGVSGSTDFDAMCANADRRCAEAVDAVVKGLPRAMQQALYAYHVDRVEAVYATACRIMARQLTLRGID